MSKVSPFTVSSSTDVCRSRFDMATSTDESNDSVSVLWRVTRWLRSVDVLQVSLSVFSRCFIVDALDLGLYRFDIDPIASPSPSTESNDSIRTFLIISGWLRCASVLQVSLFEILR